LLLVDFKEKIVASKQGLEAWSVYGLLRIMPEIVSVTHSRGGSPPWGATGTGVDYPRRTDELLAVDL
jgi:hypothetical protein